MQTTRSFLGLMVIVVGIALLGGAGLLAFGQAQEAPFEVPLGLIEPEVPPDNPLTAPKIDLGRELYFDARLSVDNKVSCSTCHDPNLNFADGKPLAEGIEGRKGPRNSPTVLNSALYLEQFWDGRAPTLEEQAKGPLINPVEMAMPSHEAVEEKVRGIAEYPPKFAEAFGEDEITIDHIVMAIASFERTLLAANSPFDRFMYGGEKNALSEAAKRGLDLYEGKARCKTCHEFLSSFALFTDDKYHNIGVGMDDPAILEIARRAERGEDVTAAADEAQLKELGRYLVTKQAKDIGAFKTPSLRNVELTAPYMHDGSVATLEEAVELYNKGGQANPFLSGEIRRLNLTDQEKADLVEFMKSLTSPDIPALVTRARGK